MAGLEKSLSISLYKGRLSIFPLWERGTEEDFRTKIIKTASENPVLWTGMKGASAESRKKVNQMLKQVQHDMTVRFCSFCHPELVSGSRFWV
jgi:hypothetical protein